MRHQFELRRGESADFAELCNEWNATPCGMRMWQQIARCDQGEAAAIMDEAEYLEVPLDWILKRRRTAWQRRSRFSWQHLCATTTDKIAYAASASITITLNSLAASTTVGRQATVIDNSTNLYDDALATVIISTSASAIGSSKTVSVYVSGSEDGTNFDQDDGVMGASDAGYTINSPTNLELAKVMNTPTSSKVYNKTWSVALLKGGVMPRKWTEVVCNDTNQALLSSGNSSTYSGITYTNG